MVKYSNFPSDQKIYGTDVLEYFGIWPVFRPIHKKQLTQCQVCDASACPVILFQPRWAGLIWQILAMPCSSHELLPGLVPPWVVRGTGSHRFLLDKILQAGRAAQLCFWLGLSGAEGFGCLALLFAFFPGCFWLLHCLRLLSGVENWSGRAPAGIPICVLSLGRLLLSSSLSFCGVSHCLHHHTLVAWGDVSLGRHQTKITTVLRLGHQPAP